MKDNSPQFIVDAMLGRLGKWLRILGYDTLFDPALGDAQLAHLARADGRILLTRDQELARRRGLRAVLVHSQTTEAQLQQVMAELGLHTGGAFSRCPVCNEPLVDLARAAAQARVPPYVFETHDRFSECPACGRVYWPGTHWQAMDGTLARLNNILYTEEETWNQEN